MTTTTSRTISASISPYTISVVATSKDGLTNHIEVYYFEKFAGSGVKTSVQQVSELNVSRKSGTDRTPYVEIDDAYVPGGSSPDTVTITARDGSFSWIEQGGDVIKCPNGDALEARYQFVRSSN